ncbi:MAG TPA: DUF87 domain-containing protein, partial [Archangium sp.]|nr:DUF87 domain-containing protein [Archangium sp.]
MSIDRRLEAFLQEGGEVFRSVQQGQLLWKRDPLDEESFNAPARGTFKRLLESAVATSAPDTGKLLLLLGDSGTGKTHLVRYFRNLVHGQGLGYVGYMPMTVDTPHYESYVLSHLIDSLDRPYDELSGEDSGLMRLSDAVMKCCTSAFAPLISAERILEDDELQGMVSSVAYDLQKTDARFLTVDVELLRALLFLQHRDVRLRHAVLQWLRCKELSPMDRKVLGSLVPRVEEDAPKRMLEQLGHLMTALGQAFVICVDQMEDMSDFKERAGMEPAFRRAVTALTHLGGNIPRAVVVLCCLSDFWEHVRERLSNAMRDRIEQDPEPVELDRVVTEDMARAMVARRLAYLFTQRGATVDPADPTWPFPAKDFKEFNNKRPRYVLDTCRRYRERAIQERRLPEQFLPSEPPDPRRRGTQQDPPGASSADLDQAWINFRAAFQAQVPTEEGEIAALLAWAIEVGSQELDGGARFSIHSRSDKSLEVTRQPEGSQLLVALCNKPSQGGHLGKQMAEALKSAVGKTPVLVRTTEFPSSVGTVVAEQILQLKKRGGRRTVLADSDLRELVALRTFRMAHPEFNEWSRTARPITRLKTVSDILGLERLDTTPPPSSTPPMSRSASVPSGGTPGPASHVGAAAVVATSLARATGVVGSAQQSEPVGPSTVAPPQAGGGSTPPPARDSRPEAGTASARERMPRGPDTASQPTTSHEMPGGPLPVGIQEGLFSQPITLEPAELTRHSAFLGGSGSGKTTVALNVVEQLLLRGIPAILVDRKGDLAAYAREEAWLKDVADGPLAERRRLLRERVDVALYTPGRSDGRPLAIPVIPRGLETLPPEERDQGVQQAADAIAGMLEYKSNPRDKAARALLGQALRLLVQRPLGMDVTLEVVQQFVQSGDPALVHEADGLDPKSFPKLVQDLTMLRLNTRVLLATGGERLDLEELLGRGPTGVSGRTRLSIISTKFLGGTPSVLFWVSQLLLETNRWASQHPSPELQAVLLFDEADLYLPAQSQPATKQPMENLLKRARSAGVGVMLATQSPGDFDYKCRENVRTWFVGRVKEDTALKKLKPMFTDARGVDVTAKLAGQKMGHFHVQRDGQVQQLKADRNLIL